MDLFARLKAPLGGTRAQTRALLEAVMTTAAWVAAAEDEVSLARRHVIDRILESVEELGAVEVHAAVDLFDAKLHDFRSDAADAAVRAAETLAAMAERERVASLLSRTAIAVACADGPVSDAVRARVERIHEALNLTPPDGWDGAGAAPAAQGGAAVAGPTVIVLGNEKGGTGKSTTAMHVAVALGEAGHRVGCIDLDSRQATLTRYVDNRKAFAAKHRLEIAVPPHRCVLRSDLSLRDAAEQEELVRFHAALAAFEDCGFIVIDTPGSDSHLSRLGHAHADILITPLNDSFLDIDVLACVDRERHEVVSPSGYSLMVREQNEQRLAEGLGAIDWVVMRNRLAQIDARNTREMARLLEQLSKRMAFRLQPGFSERVVFRELFYHGLTLLDLPEDASDPRINASRLRARRELEDLLHALNLPVAEGRAEAGRTAALAGAT